MVWAGCEVYFAKLSLCGLFDAVGSRVGLVTGCVFWRRWTGCLFGLLVMLHVGKWAVLIAGPRPPRGLFTVAASY